MKTGTRVCLASLIVGATFAHPISAAEKPVAKSANKAREKAAPASRFDQFAALTGDWISAGKGDEPGMKVNYKLTSNKSVVVETIDPGGPMEMLTLIHKDGENLNLVHYCGAGNQPQMTASNKASGNSVPFKFVHGTNMKLTDNHMHNVTYTFVDEDHLKTTWVNYDKGKPTGTVVFNHVRVK